MAGGIVAIVIIAVGLGILTDFGQTWLPQSTGSAANSSGSWVLVAFALALCARTRAVAALWGLLGLVGLVAGYYTAASARGVAESSQQIVFWTIAGLVVGPIVGLAAGWVRHGRPSFAAMGTGLVTGILAGEAIYGLTKISDTTSVGYWWVQLTVAILILVGLDVLRVRRPAALALGLVTVAVAGATTFAAYIH